MPTDTFLNLPEDKRTALLAIALDEFAEHDYNTASVSRIVARAGIAKGSIYQYFADKRDLFLYLLEHATQAMLGTLHETPPAPDAGFFTTLRFQISASARAALAFPQHSRLVRRAYSGTPPFHDELIERGRALREQYLHEMVRQAIVRGDLAADLDPLLAVATITAVLGEIGPLLVRRLGLDPVSVVTGDPAQFATPAAEQLYDDMIRILQHGLGGPRAQS